MLDSLEIVAKLNQEVLAPLKTRFVGKDQIIDLLGISLVSRENLFLLGPPGTAKSALVREMALRIDGRIFDYLLTKFTEPNELFGPFDIRKLREGELVTNTEGMLPEADFVFLDELLNANSSILNSLLMALNERVFRRGRETRSLPALFFVGASNRLPEDETLGALFDRFLLRVRCENVDDSHLGQVLEAGWRLEMESADRPTGLSPELLRSVQGLVAQVDLSPIRETYLNLIRQIRKAGMAVSDRRAVRLQRPIAASGILCGRRHADLSDLWVLRHIWDTKEQEQILAGIVQATIGTSSADQAVVTHPQAYESDRPNAEELSKGLDHLIAQVTEAINQDRQSGHDPFPAFRDQLTALATRCQWIVNDTERAFLHSKCEEIWERIKVKSRE